MEDINPIFEEFSEVFIGNISADDDIPHSAFLQRDKLDYTLESLKFIDEWLDVLYRNESELDDREWHLAVLRGGSYIGQVIRRNSPLKYGWVDYDDYVPSRPDLQKMIPERSTNTCALLVNERGSMTLPLNKVARFISEGPENNVAFYAKAECKNA